MDVRMPDGTIIRGVPDNATKDEVFRRYSAMQMAPKAERERISSGATLQFGPWDTGISIPQWLDEGLAGAGRRAMQIGTLGNNPMKDEASDRLLDDSLAATVGGALTDIGTLAGGGAALRAAGAVPQIASAAPRAAQALRATGQAMIAPRSAASAAGVGAGYGAATTDGDLLERAATGAISGSGGAAGYGLGVGVGKATRALAPMFNDRLKGAQTLVDRAGLSADDLAARVRAGDQTLVPGARPTTVEAAMVPELTQLEKSAFAQNANPFVAKRAEQDAARRAVLTGLGAPQGVTAKEAAEDAGTLIARRAMPQRAAAKADVKAAYEAIDPLGQSQIAVPVKEIDEAFKSVFGPGSGAPAPELSSLLNDVKKLTSTTEKAVAKAKIAKGIVNTDEHSLADAIRIWGGLNTKQGGGEVRWMTESDLGRRTGLGAFASKNGRLSLSRAAEKAHELGYIDADDIDVLLDKLAEEAAGTPQWSIRASEDVLAARRMPEAPDLPPVLNWQTLDNLRQRAGMIVRAANRDPKMGREGVVAGKIRDILDAEFERAAGGVNMQSGEHFPEAMQAAAQRARALHADTKARFDTGAARDVFRYGSDNLPRAQGAEVVRGFVNASDSQVADARQFMRMVGFDRGSTEAARRYALADLVEFAGPRDKPLSAAKFDGWVKARKPMLDVLFPEDQGKQLMAVRADLVRAEKAASLPAVRGSDTQKNILGGMNALQRFGVNQVVGRIPFVGGPTAAMMATAGDTAARQRAAEVLTPLLLDPDMAIDALTAYGRTGLLGRRAAPGLGLLGTATGLSLPIYSGQ
jgi:hypothetical protein